MKRIYRQGHCDGDNGRPHDFELDKESVRRVCTTPITSAFFAVGGQDEISMNFSDRYQCRKCPASVVMDQMGSILEENGYF